MALGGRVAESLTFNRITTGAQNDLQKVTKMAYAQVRVYGMSEAVGLISFPEEEIKEIGRRPYSKRLTALMDEEAQRLVAAAYLKTEQVLKDNKEKLELVSTGCMSSLSMYEGRLISNAHSEISRKRDHVFTLTKVGSKVQYFSYKLTHLFFDIVALSFNTFFPT